MSTGMTFAAVLDELDLPSLKGFTDYWRSYPPVHVLVAAYMGITPEPRPSDTPRANDPAVLADLMSAFGQTPPK